MDTFVQIKSIIKWLNKNNYTYTFKGNQDDQIKGYSTLFNYQAEKVTFISKLYNFSDYEEKFEKKPIKLIITDPSESIYDCFTNVIRIEKPTKVFFNILEEFFDEKDKESIITSDVDTYNQHSYVSHKAILGKNVKIGVGCVIEDNVCIGDNTEIHHNVVIRSKTKIGKNCIIHSGVIIGESGFNPLTLEDNSRKMIKHYGGVTLGDDVHIGVNCIIHCGTIEDTMIKNGAKINTMVHIAHNCIIGQNTVITAPTHICGSVIIGDNCHIAATTIRNQRKVGDNAVLGLGSVVIKDVEAGTTVVGNPARPLKK